MITVDRLIDVLPGVDGPNNRPDTMFLVQASGPDGIRFLQSVVEEVGQNPTAILGLYDQLASQVRRQPSFEAAYLMARASANLRNSAY